MKKVINITVLFPFAIGLIIGMFLIGFTKSETKSETKLVEKVIVHKNVKVQDWKSEKNTKKIEYYEHLYNTSK